MLRILAGACLAGGGVAMLFDNPIGLFFVVAGVLLVIDGAKNS